jgi:hypothetical protein
MTTKTEDVRTIEETVNAMVAESLEAARRAVNPQPTPEQELAQRLANATFRDLVIDEAILHGVTPRAVRFVITAAREHFELTDDGLVAKNGRTDPNDPLVPLSVGTWLE